MKKVISCKTCSNQLKGKQTLFCSLKCKNAAHQSYPSQKQRGLQRKLELCRKAGGKCSRCGYKTNLAALSFHHLESKEKDFKLDMRSLSNRKLENVMVEFNKCILLCSNCHAEVHNPELDLGQPSLSRLL
jgi:hypothetical protein